METLVALMAHVAAHGPGVPLSHYTAEWAAEQGLPLVCDRCGLPFDRTGQTRHTPEPLRQKIAAEGREAPVNEHCVRYLAADELWTCEGKALRP